MQFVYQGVNEWWCSDSSPLGGSNAHIILFANCQYVEEEAEREAAPQLSGTLCF